MSSAAVLVIGLVVLLFGVTFGIVHARRLRARGQRVPATVRAPVAYGIVLIVAVAVFLVMRALGM